MGSQPDFLPLARAAALAHERLFPGRPSKDAKTLDLLALALSELMPLYQLGAENGSLRALEKAEIAAGRFTRGATTLEYAHRPPLRSLVILRSGLDAALDQLEEALAGEGSLGHAAQVFAQLWVKKSRAAGSPAP